MMEVSLVDVCDISMGQAPKGSSYNDKDEGYALIAGAGDYGDLYPKPKKFTTQPTKLSEIGDIILCIRATIGDLNWSDKKYCLGRGVAGLRPKRKKLDKNYLWHFIKNNKSTLCALGTGSTFKQISRKHIEQFKIPLPPLEEQKRIAAILDKANALRRNREKAIALTDDLLSSIFLDMFGSSSGSTFDLKTLGDVSQKIDYGLTASANGQEVGPKFLRITDIQNNKVDWNSVPFCKASQKEQETNRLEKGDIVFARTGATTGKSFLITECPTDAVFASYLIRVRSDNSIIPEFLAAFFRTEDYWSQIKQKAQGAAQPGVNSTKLKELVLPVPPIDQQRKFAEKVESTSKLVSKMEVSLLSYNNLLSSLTQQAFRGDLTPQKEAA